MPEPPTPTLLRPPSADARAYAASRNGEPGAAGKPKLKKLRLALILLGLSVLAIISTVFGMMMAVASDLPALESQAEFRSARNSLLFPDEESGQRDPIAKLTGNQNRILVGETEISPSIKNAVLAVEDQRFYEHDGVDYTGIARALLQDIRQQRAAQGGSTVTQQFVKNALAAQGNRSVFQKLRESALAYHLEREWSKQKILTQYLNSVYFGNGAYGVESAARVYFGNEADEAPTDSVVANNGQTPDEPAGTGADEAAVNSSDTGDSESPLEYRAATNLRPHEAALLAGLIASPTAYDPIQNPRAARQRRDLVLNKMLEQELITRPEYEAGIKAAIPAENDVDPPSPDSTQPYFSSWVTQQLVDDYGSGQVFAGGLKIKTTLDPELQEAAEQAIEGRLAGVGPNASLVAIENKTGEVKALVGGTDFDGKPFNLATNGHRQPGSAFKPFTLIAALRDGVSPTQTFASKRKVFPVPGSRDEKFVVNNYEDRYSGVASLISATAQSDNSVYAELGLRVGTKKIAKLAKQMGIRTPMSTNPAMTLGGLKEGVTPLELAYAYSTIANKGVRVSGTLASSEDGPVAIEQVNGAGIDESNELVKKRVFSEEVGEEAHRLLEGVIVNGTGQAAQIDEFAGGKTGTTENYGDAWFAGFNKDYTVAVWVGYADRLQFMKTEYRGGPVAGGAFPAEIWRDFMTAAIRLRQQRNPDDEPEEASPPAPVAPAAPAAPAPAPAQTAPVEPPAQQPPEPAPEPPAPPKQPQQQPPQQAAPPAPSPQPGGGGKAPPGSG
jgi:penicillin-binding protein 1A